MAISTELSDLLAQRRLPITHGNVTALGLPPALPPPAEDRVRGMLLGLAIGDSLGNTTEGRRPHSRHEEYGEIRDYVPNWHAGDRPVGLPSDDTQFAFWLLECLLEDGRIVPDRLAAAFSTRRIYGIGHTTRQFIRAFKEQGLPWYEAAQKSAGNGAVMRVAPVVLPHLDKPTTALWEDAILSSAVTHNDPTAIAASVAVAGILWDVLRMDAPPKPAWWLDRYVELARPLDGAEKLKPREAPIEFEGALSTLVDTEVRRVLESRVSVLEACDCWHSGAYLLETMPCVLYILAKHASDPEEAIVRAVNDTVDNDTVAAVVGAVVGALHGESALPKRWRDGLLGRTGAEDDGRVFELIDSAVARFLPSPRSPKKGAGRIVNMTKQFEGMSIGIVGGVRPRKKS